MSGTARIDVAEALNGSRHYEVPFSMHVDANGTPAIVRGTIDCLVRKSPSALTVVELKTGRPRARDRRQLDLYVRAALTLHPGTFVDGILLYL